MRHDDMGRLRAVDGIWFRIRLWLGTQRPSRPVITDFDTLSEHQRKDIGLPEPARYVDWKALRTEAPFPDFTR